MVGTQLSFMYCPSAPANRTMVYTDALSQAFYGANWSVTLAAGDYAVDDGVDSGWMDRNHVPHPAGQDTRGLLHGNVAPRFASVTDGTSNTIMVSEDAGRPDLYLDGRLISVGTVIPWYQGGNAVTQSQRRLRGRLGRLQQRVLHRRRLQPERAHELEQQQRDLLVPSRRCQPRVRRRLGPLHQEDDRSIGVRGPDQPRRW